MRCIVGLQMLKTYRTMKSPSVQNGNSQKLANTPKARFAYGCGVITNHGRRIRKRVGEKKNTGLYRKLLYYSITISVAYSM